MKFKTLTTILTIAMFITTPIIASSNTSGCALVSGSSSSIIGGSRDGGLDDGYDLCCKVIVSPNVLGPAFAGILEQFCLTTEDTGDTLAACCDDAPNKGWLVKFLFFFTL